MSVFFLQLNYAKLLGTQLDRFKIKRTSPFLANSRCAICGDSDKNKQKTRFYIYEKSNQLNCACHNCGLSTTLVNYLKLYHTNLFDEYIFEKFKVTDSNHVITDKVTSASIEFIPEKIISKKRINLDLPLVSSLPDGHFAKEYVKQRKLPDYPFQYAEEFFKFSKQYNNEIKAGKTDESRLVIPFFDRQGNTFAYQGRAIGATKGQKYITCIVNEKIPKIFGVDRVKINEPMLLVEGPLDSLFLPNCIASVNASLTATANKFLVGINKSQDSIVLVFDNEPRNVSVVSQYEKAISAGFKVVLWPRMVDGMKDINDMICAGIDVVKIINKNTYYGLDAKLKFSGWRKV